MGNIRSKIIICLELFSSIVYGTALDLNPPSWRGNAYTTTQQWHFLTDDTQPYVDSWDNPFGRTETEVLSDYSPLYDGATSAWKWSMVSEFAEAHMLKIGIQPNWPDSTTDKQARVQITWGIDFQGATPPYDQADMIYVSNFDGIDGIFPTPLIDAQFVGTASNIDWYHTTFRVPFVDSILHEDEYGNSWIEEIDAPWSNLYVFPYHFMTEPLTDNFDIYVAGVVVDTICVPEPAMLLLLTVGGLALRHRK